MSRRHPQQQQQSESPSPATHAANALSRREQRLQDCRNSVWGEIVELGHTLTTKPATLERAMRDGSLDRVVFSCKMYLYDPTIVQAGLTTVQQSLTTPSSSSSTTLTDRYRRLGWVEVLHDALAAFPQESDEFIALALWNLEHVANLETVLPKTCSTSNQQQQHHQHHANKRDTRCFNRDTRWLIIPKKKKKLLPTVIDILSQTLPEKYHPTASEAAKIRLLLRQRAMPILSLIITLFQQEDAEAGQQPPQSESSSRKLAPLLLANDIIAVLYQLLLFLLSEQEQKETSSSSTILVYQATRVLFHLLQACCSTQRGSGKKEENKTSAGPSLAWVCRSAVAHELMDPMVRVLQQYSTKEVVDPTFSPETNNSNGHNSHPSLAPEIVRTLVDCLWYLTTEIATQSRKIQHDSFASTSRLNGNGNGDTKQTEEEELEDEEEELVLEEALQAALVDCLTQNIVPSRQSSLPGKKPTVASSTLSLCSSDDDDEFIYGIRGRGGEVSGGGLNPPHPGGLDPHVIATALIVLDNLKKMAVTTTQTSPTTATKTTAPGDQIAAPAARRDMDGADVLSVGAAAPSSFLLREDENVAETTNSRFERRRAALQQRMSSASMSSISSASTASTTTTRSSSAGSFAGGDGGATVRPATAAGAAAGTGAGVDHQACTGPVKNDEDEDEGEEEESKSLSSSSHSSSSSNSSSSSSSSSASSSSGSSCSSKVDAGPTATAKAPAAIPRSAFTTKAPEKMETTNSAPGIIGRTLPSKDIAAEQRQAAAVCVLNGSRWEKLSSEKQSTCRDGANADTLRDSLLTPDRDDDSSSSSQNSSSNSISLASFQAASLHSSYHSSTSNASASTSTSSLHTPDPAPAVWKNNQGMRALPSGSNRSRSSRRRRRRRRRQRKEEAKHADEVKHPDSRNSRWDSSPPPPSSSSALATLNHQPKPPSRDIKTSARMVRGSRWDSSPPREKDTTPPRQPQDKATTFALRKSR